LDGLWKEFEDIVNLILETTRKHLIGLIKEELTDIVKTEVQLSVMTSVLFKQVSTS
jgi:hypothetical protein